MCRQHVLSVLRSGNDLLFRRVYCFSMCVTQDISLETNLLWPPSIKLQNYWYCQHITLMFFMKKREYHIIHMYFLFRVVHKKSFFNQDFYHIVLLLLLSKRKIGSSNSKKESSISPMLNTLIYQFDVDILSITW